MMTYWHADRDCVPARVIRNISLAVCSMLSYCICSLSYCISSLSYYYFIVSLYFPHLHIESNYWLLLYIITVSSLRQRLCGLQLGLVDATTKQAVNNYILSPSQPMASVSLVQGV